MVPVSPRRGVGAMLSYPQSFLGIVSLRSGAEIIALSLLITKLPGVYGLVALVSGHALSASQLVMYAYSAVFIAALVWLLPRFNQHDARSCMVVAWMYTADSVIHAMFIAGFGVDWYYARAASSTTTTTATSLSAAETSVSLGLAACFCTLRFYCATIMLAYARLVTRVELRADVHRDSDAEAGTAGLELHSLLNVAKGSWFTSAQRANDDNAERLLATKKQASGRTVRKADDDAAKGSVPRPGSSSNSGSGSSRGVQRRVEDLESQR